MVFCSGDDIKGEKIRVGNNAKRVGKDRIPLTIGQTLACFGYACLFGIAYLPAWLELKDLIPLLIRVLSGNRYVTQLATIVTTVVLAMVWIVLFFILWNRMERDFDYKRCFLQALLWSGIALAVFVLARLGSLALNGYLAA